MINELQKQLEKLNAFRIFLENIQMLDAIEKQEDWMQTMQNIISALWLHSVKTDKQYWLYTNLNNYDDGDYIILELYQLGTLVKLYYINDHIGYKRSIIIGLKPWLISIANHLQILLSDIQDIEIAIDEYNNAQKKKL